MGLVDLFDVGLGYLLLLFIGVKDRAPVLGADIGALPVKRSRVVGNAEEDLQDLAIRNLGGVEGDQDGFGVAGASSGNDVILRRFLSAAGVAGNHVVHSFDHFEHGFRTPEASA